MESSTKDVVFVKGSSTTGASYDTKKGTFYTYGDGVGNERTGFNVRVVLQLDGLGGAVGEEKLGLGVVKGALVLILQNHGIVGGSSVGVDVQHVAVLVEREGDVIVDRRPKTSRSTISLPTTTPPRPAMPA